MSGNDVDPSFVQLRTFDWLIAVAASDLKPEAKVTAMALPGRTGKGGALTGARVQPLPDVTAACLGVSLRTVERHVETLAKHPGYLRRTRRPTSGEPAEYALFGPAEFNGSTSGPSATPAGKRGGRSSVEFTRSLGGRARRSEPVTPDTDTHNLAGGSLSTPAKSGGVRPPRSRAIMAGYEQLEQEQPPPYPPSDLRAGATPSRREDEKIAHALHTAGVTEPAEVEWLIAELRADPATMVPASRAREPGWLTPARAKYSAEQRAQVVAQIDRLRAGPDCEHGDPGGEAPHPISREPLCPQCRTAAAVAAS